MTNLLAKAKAAVQSKHSGGQSLWSEIAPTVDYLISEGWGARRTWDWLVEQGYTLQPEKYRNFEVSFGRRKKRLINPKPPTT